MIIEGEQIQLGRPALPLIYKLY